MSNTFYTSTGGQYYTTISTNNTMSNNAGGYFSTLNTTLGPITTSQIAAWSSLNNYTPPAMNVQGDLEVNGSLKVKGKDIGKLIEKIESRLAILLEPTSERLEKYAALKKAYDHYILMEKLLNEE